jgi:hypothetical protein
MQLATRQRVQTNQDLWDRIWRDRTGRVVIYQNPNPVLIAWVVLTIASIVTNGMLSNVLWYVALALLAIWALLEIFKGVNYFRRAIGVIVVLLIVAALFKFGY